MRFGRLPKLRGGAQLNSKKSSLEEFAKTLYENGVFIEKHPPSAVAQQHFPHN